MTRSGIASLCTLTLTMALAAACAAPQRRMDDIAIDKPLPGADSPQGQNNVLLNAASFNAKPLPPPAMDAKRIRQELWSIAARRQRGEIGLTIADYAQRAKQQHTLENRFLAAAAIADDDEAWKQLSALSAEYPKFYWAHAGIAMIYTRWKVRDQCEKEIGFMLDLMPDEPYSYTVRGDLYRNIGEFQMAVRDYSTALRADSTDADARVGLALAKEALGTQVDLRAEFEHALKDVPTDYEAAVQLAQLLDAANEKQGATEAWDRVSHLAPKNRTAQLALARLQGAADPSAAIVAYEKAARQSPLSKVEQQSLAGLYKQTGRVDDEIKSLDTLAHLDPKDSSAYRRLAEIAWSRNDLPAAEGAYQAVLKINEKDAVSIFGLGQVAEKRTQLKQAIDYYRQAAAAGSANAGVELKRLSAECFLPDHPLAAPNLGAFYGAVLASLNDMYKKRLELAPRLRGQMKIKIETDGEGALVEASVTENTLNDPWMEAHLYYSVADGKIPKLKASDPKKFSFTFDLPPASKK